MAQLSHIRVHNCTAPSDHNQLSKYLDCPHKLTRNSLSSFYHHIHLHINNQCGRNNSNHGRGGRNNYAQAPPAPTANAPTADIPPAPTNAHIHTVPNANKWFNNLNYCSSCGYDIPIWHTSATCNDQKPNHQVGCTQANVAAYKAAGHVVATQGSLRTIMPTSPTAEQA